MRHALRVSAAVAGFFLLALGCNKKEDTGPPPSPVKNPPVQTAAATGPELFQQHCAKCHPTGGKGGKMKAPDLGKSAADPEHTADWIAAHIRDPKIHSPESRMPAFESKLSADQIRVLAEYITTLK
jgi:mono/diheme cytochrome c family protein